MTYRTPHGSVVRLSGKRLGIEEIQFDWLEEGGCIDCQCTFNRDWNEPALEVYCDNCGSRLLPLTPVEEVTR